MKKINKVDIIVGIIAGIITVVNITYNYNLNVERETKKKQQAQAYSRDRASKLESNHRVTPYYSAGHQSNLGTHYNGEGCGFKGGERIPLLSYTENSEASAVRVIHPTCMGFNINHFGHLPGVVVDPSLTHSVIGITNVTDKGNVLKLKWQIVAPPCSNYTEVRERKYVIEQSKTSSSVLLGLVYSSESSSVKYKHERDEREVPLTLCVTR